MGKFDFLKEEASPTVIVTRIDTSGAPLDVRINESDFDPAVDILSSETHRVPANYVAPAVDTPTPAPGAPAPAVDVGKGGKGGKAGKAATPPVVDPVQAFTVESGGKFYRCDAMGKILNPEGFDTAELAGAAPITVTE